MPGRSVDLRHEGKHCPGGKRMPESALWEVNVELFEFRYIDVVLST